MKQYIQRLFLVIFIACAGFILPGCNPSGDEETKLVEPSAVLNRIKDILPEETTQYYKTTDQEETHVAEEVQSINTTLASIQEDIVEAEKIEDEEKQETAVTKIKKKVFDYFESNKGKENQFGTEFKRIFIDTDFNEISDEKVLNTLERIANGFDKAEDLLSKALKLTSKFGSAIATAIDFYLGGRNEEVHALLAPDGVLYQIGKAMEKVHIGRRILATVSNASAKVIRFFKKIGKTEAQIKEANKKEKAKQGRRFLEIVKEQIQKDETLNAFVESSIPKKQHDVGKIHSWIANYEESIAEQEAQEDKPKSSSQSTNMLSDDNKLIPKPTKEKRSSSPVNMCNDKSQFQYFCLD